MNMKLSQPSSRVSALHILENDKKPCLDLAMYDHADFVFHQNSAIHFKICFSLCTKPTAFLQN